jgi:muramoyltetrapeptide carboxypeptidase
MEFLKKNDKIGIVSTARKISEEEIIPAIRKFQEWGLNVVLGKNIFNIYNQFAGTDEERAADFQEFLDDDEVKAIICSRGGYGTIRIIDKLNFTRFIEKPKWIAGYSDITAIHSLLQSKFNFQSIHSSMAFNFPHDNSSNKSVESLKEALFGCLSEYYTEKSVFNKKGEAEGILAGGNLSILYSLLGTRFDPDIKNKILFIEDIDEYLYHIDRIMMSFELSGKLKNLAGLIVGGMTDMKDNTIPFGKNACEIISEHVSKYNYPVIFNFNAGHSEPNLALYFGRKINMTVSEEKAVIKYI